MGDEVGKVKSPLPHIFNHRDGKSFFIDTDAEISAVQPIADNKKSKTFQRTLKAANGAPIPTFGNRSITIEIGNKKFRWTFVVAEVLNNILGIDFTKHFSLSLDFENGFLLDKNKYAITKYVC